MQPGTFASRPEQPRLLTPAPVASIPAGPTTATNHLLALGQMSPCSVHSAIASHNLPANTYRAIINGLVVTSEACTHRFTQDLTAQETEHKKKLDDRNETIEFMEAHLIGYIDTFSRPPDGYVKNGRLTMFTIPCSNGLSNPAKWVKKLDDAMPCPSIQLTLWSLYPIGSMKPFKGQPLDTLPSLMQSRLRTIGGSKLMLCGLEPSTSNSSLTKPNSPGITASSKAPLSPETSHEEDWSAQDFPSGFHIWQE